MIRVFPRHIKKLGKDVAPQAVAQLLLLVWFLFWVFPPKRPKHWLLRDVLWGSAIDINPPTLLYNEL